MYPSHYEGWGLPVTESLCFGKVPAVSRISSLPEAGGEFAQYFQPSSARETFAVVERLVLDEAYRASLEAKIRSSFRPRSWRTITEDLIAGVAAIRTKADQPAAASGDASDRSTEEFRSGLIYTMARRGGGSHSLAPSARDMRIGDGWNRCEDWGAWTAAGSARLKFRPAERANSAIIFYLKLRCPIQDKINVEIATSFSDELYSVAFEPGQEKWIRLRFEAEFEPDKPEELILSNSALVDLSAFVRGDQRTIGCGVINIAYCEEADIAARMNILDVLALVDVLNYGRVDAG